MPKIGAVRAAAERTAQASAGLNARLAPVDGPVGYPHCPEDHYTWSDGVRVCVCVCLDCWPTGTEGPCHWTEGS